MVLAHLRVDELDDAGELGQLPPPVLHLHGRAGELALPPDLLELREHLDRMKSFVVVANAEEVTYPFHLLRPRPDVRLDLLRELHVGVSGRRS